MCKINHHKPIQASGTSLFLFLLNNYEAHEFARATFSSHTLDWFILTGLFCILSLHDEHNYTRQTFGLGLLHDDTMKMGRVSVTNQKRKSNRYRPYIFFIKWELEWILMGMFYINQGFLSGQFPGRSSATTTRNSLCTTQIGRILGWLVYCCFWNGGPALATAHLIIDWDLP